MTSAIGRAAADREADFDALVGPLIEPAFKLAIVFLRDPHEAEDAVQEATLKAWRSLDRLRDESAARAWFLAIVANQCRSKGRGRWWSVLRVESPRREHFEDPPDERLDLAREMSRLPETDRAALFLFFYLDLPLTEVARVLKTSPQAAKSRGAPRGEEDAARHGGGDRMTDVTRNRINAAFDDELSAAPVPPGLRALSIRDAVTAPPHRSVQPQLLIVVATIVVLAVVATFVIGSHLLRSSVPLPAKQTGSQVPPAARSGADIVYDAAHHELVLFGGSTIGGRFTNETWTWDGKYWTLHPTSPTVLSPRDQAVIAYDQVHHVTVMYGGMKLAVPGGKGGVAAANDTWTWDGNSWKQQNPAHEPGLTFDWPATMDFDSGSRTVLLYGFQKLPSGNSTTMQAQTWSWNGSDWTRLSPSTSPGTVGQLVGGYLIAPSADRVAGRYVSQVWLWNGSNWVLLGSGSDAPFASGSAAYDAKGSQLVVFNGDTWTWDGHGWTRLHTAHEPPAAGYMTYFPPLQAFVQYGAVYGNTNNDVWAWNGADWTLLEAGSVAPPTPSGRLGPTTPDAAKAFVRQTMTATTPALFPAWLPPSMEATVVATTDQFNLDLASDQRDKTIFLGTVAANPPPGGPNSSDTHVKFRNALAMKYQRAGTAEYFVYDASAPRSDRWLMWLEPGTTSVQGSTSPGVWYFLSASGLTDQEFWQVANSLQ